MNQEVAWVLGTSIVTMGTVLIVAICTWGELASKRRG